jgi:anti-sigma regulatory factor (Ser/Thr protein kinase)
LNFDDIDNPIEKEPCRERLRMSVSFSLALPRDPSASRLARAAIRERLSGLLTVDQLADVTLATSELITNAVLHGGGGIELRVDADERHVRGEVIDAGRGLEQQIRDHGVKGPGLRIVGRVAGKWGVFQGTTHVWFEIPLDGAKDEQAAPIVGRPPAGEPT